MNEPSLRLFFALPCPGPAAEALAAWARANYPGARHLHPSDLHVTLAFLGNQPASSVPRVIELAAGLSLPDITLKLSITERWKNLLVLLPEAVPDSLLAFQTSLQERLANAGLSVDRRPYRPHLTLARGLGEAPVSGTPPRVAWQARQWGLYHSVQGQPRYQLLANWSSVSGRNSLFAH